MIKKTLALLLLMLITGRLGFLAAKKPNPDFESLNIEEMYQKIISYRDLAIQKAVKSGNYKCCINPPCTMCYMQANEWNNFTAGTCACDDLIAQGKEPCPQCKTGLCEAEGKNTGSCKINLEENE